MTYKEGFLQFSPSIIVVVCVFFNMRGVEWTIWPIVAVAIAMNYCNQINLAQAYKVMDKLNQLRFELFIKETQEDENN